MRPVRAARDTTDFLVVGGGIVGLTVALEMKRRFPGAGVTVLEKEGACGQHASGRNSGVLHAGFYYSADSLKARFSREGNRLLTAYCLDRGLPINRCGKLVVARTEAELPRLDELFARARANGVEVEEVSAREAREIEPLASTCEKALFSPTTACVDPGRVMATLVRDVRQAGIDLRTETEFLGRGDSCIRTSGGRIAPGFLINAAGLYADRIAREFGHSQRYRILPFKGLYLQSRRSSELPRTNIYPVPDLQYPFLGVHFTVTAHDAVKVGPTAIPALWRENYRGFAGFSAADCVQVAGIAGRLLLSNAFGFRKLAIREVSKYSKRRVLERASELIDRRLSPGNWRWIRAGIRAQLVDVKEQKLEMDFKVVGDAGSLHVLNAISPAFTCAWPFAGYIADEIGRLTGHTRSGEDAGGRLSLAHGSTIPPLLNS